MKKVLNIIGALAVAFIMPLSALADSAPDSPALPVHFQGGVKINGSVAPVGTAVTAEVGDEVIDSYALEVAGKYYMDISEDDVTVGSVIKFKINGKEAGQTNMVNVKEHPKVALDLAITTSTPSVPPSSGGGVTPPPVNDDEDDDNEEVQTTGEVHITTSVTNPVGSLASDDNGKVLAGTDINVIDGDIIQCKNSANPFAVYIVKEVNGKKYIRHIVSLEIFNHYKHLKWENLIQVESLDGYLLSGWVRVNTGANGNPGASDRVFEINGDQSRHWIDMTAGEFLLHGGSDEAIYSVNAGELSLYREGPAVKLQ